MDTRGNITHERDMKKPQIKISQQEASFLSSTAPEHRFTRLISLRFKMWLAYNKLNPTPIEKTKLRKAYTAGVMMSIGQDPEIVE